MSEKIDFLFAIKPCGVATHRPSDDRLGFVEWLEAQHGQSLKVCHRLDKETSGVLVFAKNSLSADALTQLFSTRQVRKEYLFVSTKKSKWDQWYVREEKAKGTQIAECPWRGGDHEVASFTEFSLLGSEGQFYLYKAYPHTGKTHQIRKHASQSKVSILGDELYGGEPFARLMLHAQKLSFTLDGQEQSFQAPPSRLFEDLKLCSDPQVARWIVAYERREILFPEKINSNQCMRLFHSETTDLRGEQLGKRLVLGWWKKEHPSGREQKSLNRLMKTLGKDDWVFQWRPGAQEKNAAEVLLTGHGYEETPWVFEEGECRYRATLDRGQNAGLFLDQRQRRKWVQDNSQGKRVLNLFAFTCGFSLNGARGGARQVVSVDLFQKYLDWGKENFELNDINPENFEFRKMDSMDYLNYAQKKGLQFDIVVCDPPSFSRQKKSKKVFRVERDFPQLLNACVQCLSPGGVLLFSTNYEKWDLKKWQKELGKWAKAEGLEVETDWSQWDFEWQPSDAILKAFFIRKA